MGEAKRRSAEIEHLKVEIATWRAGLSPEQTVILDLAERLDERLVRGRRFSEGCYHLAFFMTLFCAELGIEVKPVIGWVNDGTWKGMTSHAWIEYKGTKTDASLTHTSVQDVQLTGGLIVHDRVLRKGEANYRYFYNEDQAVMDAHQWMDSVPEWKHLLTYKANQHQHMMQIARDNKLADYLANAPAGGRYADLIEIVR